MIAPTDLGKQRRAKANPTKAFFVRMLTRDISLEDCILDLVDNSIDAAWRAANATPTTFKEGTALAQFAIHIAIDDNNECFTITDNCGGISLDDAVNYAFTFGRRPAHPTEDFAVGVYGIGMKRAVFKLGNSIRIRSTTTTDPPYVVPIDVKSWLENIDDIWDFHIEDDDPLAEPGLQVTVSDPTEESRATFSDPAFVNRLRATVEQDYLLPLMQGLTITLNNMPVKAWELGLRHGSGFEPMRDLYRDGDVSVEILAGMIRSPSDDTEPSERNPDHRSGWYVMCNGRVVVTADRSDLTVWARHPFPQWHPQYEGFVGVVLFSSRRPELLPMTTTKSGVDISSPVYRRAVAKMQIPTRAWIDYTHARKKSPITAKSKEHATALVPVSKIGKRKQIILPHSASKPSEKQANVLYTVPVRRLKKLATAFGRSTLTYKDVGQKSFDYAYDQLVDED